MVVAYLVPRFSNRAILDKVRIGERLSTPTHIILPARQPERRVTASVTPTLCGSTSSVSRSEADRADDYIVVRGGRDKSREDVLDDGREVCLPGVVRYPNPVWLLADGIRGPSGDLGVQPSSGSPTRTPDPMSQVA
jgi:hypothetical protein